MAVSFNLLEYILVSLNVIHRYKIKKGLEMRMLKTKFFTILRLFTFFTIFTIEL